MWIFGRKGPSGYSACSTAEEVTHGIDGSGITAIITGASSGLGTETTRVLALHGVHVIMAVRSKERGVKVKDTIVEETEDAKIDIMELDLSSMASIRKFASEYNSLGLPLNILINNAGVFGTPFALSQDNIELQFATNHLGHFLLTNLLLDNMKRTAIESHREGRIINVSSMAHRHPLCKGICFDKINDKSSYDRNLAYAQSKLANILHANELSRRLKEEGAKITAYSLHPGVIPTKVVRHQSFLGGLFWISRYVLKNINQGAATTCYLALHPRVKGISGKYFEDCNTAEPSPPARNEDLGKKLWNFSLNLTGTK